MRNRAGRDKDTCTYVLKPRGPDRNKIWLVARPLGFCLEDSGARFSYPCHNPPVSENPISTLRRQLAIEKLKSEMQVAYPTMRSDFTHVLVGDHFSSRGEDGRRGTAAVETLLSSSYPSRTVSDTRPLPSNYFNDKNLGGR